MKYIIHNEDAKIIDMYKITFFSSKITGTTKGGRSLLVLISRDFSSPFAAHDRASK